MTTLVTSDLDRTLIYSRAAARDGFARVNPVIVEYYQGEPLSYMAAEAHSRLAELATQVPVVPTTTRTVEQYRRIELPGAPHRYAICANGGEILVDGAPDRQWQARTAAAIAGLPASLTDITAALAPRLAASWGARLREVPGLFVYVVSDVQIPTEVVTQWQTYCAPLGWVVSRQGRKLYTIPASVSKSQAAQEVRSRLIAEGAITANSPWLAAGDGALDADLLTAADASIRPQHGELHELAFTAPQLRCTATAGIEAGTEIVDWFTAAAVQATP